MRFELYTDKTVAQCLTAINARMQAKETSTRPAIDGWVEKGGAFSISTSTRVVGRFNRRTHLSARLERENGVTVIRGNVATGVDRQGQALVFIALGLMVVLFASGGNVAPALVLLPLAAYLYIPMKGDYINSDVLLTELQRLLKAKSSPPKKTSEKKPAAREAKDAPRSSRGTTARKPTSAAKPAAAARPESALENQEGLL